MCALVKRRYGYNIEIGENFFANHNTVILDGAKVTFGTMYLLLRTADFILPDIPLILNAEAEGWNMPTPLQLAAMYGLAPVFRSCPALRLGVML